MKALRLAAFLGNFAELKRLCKEERRRVNEEGPETRRTALHWAALGGHPVVVNYLLKAVYVDVDPMDRELNTPLNLVVQVPDLTLEKRLTIIDILLAHGADPVRANLDGKTPLMNLETLRERIPDNDYYQRQLVEKTIRKIRENKGNHASGVTMHQGYVPESSPAYVFEAPAVS